MQKNSLTIILTPNAVENHANTSHKQMQLATLRRVSNSDETSAKTKRNETIIRQIVKNAFLSFKNHLQLPPVCVAITRYLHF